MSQVEFLLTVGKLDASLALLTTDDHHVIEFPTVLLPDNVKAGSIVKLSVSQTFEEEKKQRDLFREVQAKILEKYGTHRPSPPVLKVVNVTQTSCVLAWDPLQLGSASLKSLVLYRQGVRSTVIPCPLKTNTTKISGLSVDTDYEFELKLTTTSGQLWSEKVKMHTHKMTDMSGITVCLGPLDPLLGISGAQVVQSLSQIGARPMQKKVAIDTTHFVTNDVDNDDDPELIKAKNSNIPIVRPEWVRASEMERRIVGVRGFYLDADQGILKSYQFPPATEEANKLFARIKAGETTENLNDKELPQPKEYPQDAEAEGKPEEGEKVSEEEHDQTSRINEQDLKDAAEPPIEELRDEGVAVEAQESAEPETNELTDAQAEEDLPVAQVNENENEAMPQQENAPVADNKDVSEEISRPEEGIQAAETIETGPSDVPNSDPVDRGENLAADSSVSKPAESDVEIEPATANEESITTTEQNVKEELPVEDEPEEEPQAEAAAPPASEPEEINASVAEANAEDPAEPAATTETASDTETKDTGSNEDTPETELDQEHVEVAEIEEDDETVTKESSPSAKKTTKKNKNKKKNKKKK